jgi:hypothetical protein
VFHSLRHNMADTTRDAKMNIEASTVMMGHTLPGARALYGKGMSIAPLKEEMDRIKPPIDLVAMLKEAQRGKFLAAADFSKPTHGRFWAERAKLVTLAEAGDIEGLKAIKINPVSTSPKAMARYRDLAIIAIQAQSALQTSREDR